MDGRMVAMPALSEVKVVALVTSYSRWPAAFSLSHAIAFAVAWWKTLLPVSRHSTSPSCTTPRPTFSCMVPMVDGEY